MRQRHALFARIQQIRRGAGASDLQPETELVLTQPARLAAFEARLEHLEKLVEGLQDSVHREWKRQSQQIAELEAQLDPATLAAALSRNARERGL
jgi:hypothetical protein